MFTVKSLKFVEELARRRNSWSSSSSTVSARLRLTEDMKWWYWVEFGTAFHGSMSINTPTNNPEGYRIPGPDYTARKLKFPDGRGGFHIRADVWHMGIHPHHMVSAALDDLPDIAKVSVEEWLSKGTYDWAELQLVLYDQIMPRIVTRIGESFQERLNTGWIDGYPGVRTDDGAHLGRPAYQEFLANVQIIR